MAKGEPAPTVTVRIPPVVKATPEEIAVRCGWEIQPTGIGDQYAVRPDETRRLLAAKRAIGASGAKLAGWERAFAWRGQDAYMAPAWRRELLTKATELSTKRTRVAAWATFDLLNIAATDLELPSHLAQMYPELARQLPHSSLWAVMVDPALHSRRAAVRTFLALDAAPELTRRDPLTGLDSGKGLGASEGMSIGPLLEVGLLASAPGTLGFVSARLPGLVVLLFGQLEAGRDPAGDPAELMDLYRPRLLSVPAGETATYPRLPTTQHEEFFSWWLDRAGALIELSTDPRRFRRPDGFYDPAAHYGFQLTLDRLVATVKGILVGARRDEFTRTILMFQALDLLKGLRLGDYQRLADPALVERYVDDLRGRLPDAVQAFVMPRIDGVAAALMELRRNFFLHERIAEDKLTVVSKAGKFIQLGLHRATAEYLNLVRDAGHTWAEKLASDHYLSLFMAHNGDLPPQLADLAFLHFVRLMVQPEIAVSVLR